MPALTERELHRLLIVGFCLLYLSGMGALVVMTAPIFDQVREIVLKYIVTPGVIFGLGMILYARVKRPEI